MKHKLFASCHYLLLSSISLLNSTTSALTATLPSSNSSVSSTASSNRKPDGELMTTQTLKWCNKVIQKNLPDISHFHFHCLKHTYATTLVAAGANVKDVQELLGHSDIKFTLNTYSHVTRQTRKKAVGIFENTIHGMG